MAEEEPYWIRALTEQITRPTPLWEYMQQRQPDLQQQRQQDLQLQQGALQQALQGFTTFTNYGVEPVVQAPPITGEVMITFHPPAEEIDNNEKTHVRNWIMAAAAGKTTRWPGFPATVRVNGRGKYITAGATWLVSDGDNRLYVGNSNEGLKSAPLWAPSCLMAIARVYRLEEEPDLVKHIREMLSAIVVRDVVPVVTELAAATNGSPVTEIAVNTKERIFVGRYPDPQTGKPGPFRHMSGEPVEVTGPDWVKLKM